MFSDILMAGYSQMLVGVVFQVRMRKKTCAFYATLFLYVHFHTHSYIFYAQLAIAICICVHLYMIAYVQSLFPQTWLLQSTPVSPGAPVVADRHVPSTVRPAQHEVTGSPSGTSALASHGSCWILMDSVVQGLCLVPAK